jgi:hypothetical protein
MALVTALMATLMMLALGAGVTLTTMTETTVAANHRDGMQALYAAEAGADLAVNRLRAVADWRSAADAGSGAPFLQGGLADLLQSSDVESRIDVTVTLTPDPGGNEDVLVLQSSAIVAGGIRRNIQITIRRRPAEADGTRRIETVSWRER